MRTGCSNQFASHLRRSGFLTKFLQHTPLIFLIRRLNKNLSLSSSVEEITDPRAVLRLPGETRHTEIAVYITTLHPLQSTGERPEPFLDLCRLTVVTKLYVMRRATMHCTTASGLTPGYIS